MNIHLSHINSQFWNNAKPSARRIHQSFLITCFVHQAWDPLPVLGLFHREPGPILEDRLSSLSSYTISSMPTILGHYRCFSASLQPLTSSDPGSIQMRTVQHRLCCKPVCLQRPSPRRCLGRYDWKRGCVADHIMNLYLLKTFRRKLAENRLRIPPQSVESKVESGTHTSQSFDNTVYPRTVDFCQLVSQPVLQLERFYCLQGQLGPQARACFNMSRGARHPTVTRF